MFSLGHLLEHIVLRRAIVMAAKSSMFQKTICLNHIFKLFFCLKEIMHAFLFIRTGRTRGSGNGKGITVPRQQGFDHSALACARRSRYDQKQALFLHSSFSSLPESLMLTVS